MIDLFTPHNLADLAHAVRTCTRCDLCRTRKHAILGEGNTHAKIMFVGQSASEADNITGRNYSGPSGNILDIALERVGLTRADIYLTNMVKCVPLAPRKEDGVLDYRTPKPAEVRACRAWLDQEIALVQPNVLVLFGVPTLKVLVDPKFKLADDRGKWFHVAGIPAIATWQPAYLMRMKEWDRPKAVQGWKEYLSDLRADVERANME